LANHLWELDGSPPADRDKVNQTFLQPFLSYTNSTLTTWGVNTESTYNWQSSWRGNGPSPELPALADAEITTTTRAVP